MRRSLNPSTDLYIALTMSEIGNETLDQISLTFGTS